MIPLVDVGRQFASLRKALMAEIEQVTLGGQYILGPKVKELEARMKERFGGREVVAVGNGTDALILILQAFGIGPGDEVITTPFTFFATAEAISRVGAAPLFVDIDPESFNLNPSLVERAITPRTKAILPVHLFGQPADMASLKEIAKKHHLYLFEDACQAFGATYRGMPAGSLGDAAAFSFFPTKNLGTMGDGGLVVTAHPQMAARIRLLRQHGSRQKYYHEAIGMNSRLDELHAAILLIGLREIDRWNDLRRKKAARYGEALQELSYLKTPKAPSDREHIWHLYTVVTEEREKVRQFLANRGIQTGVYYPLPLHLQEVYRSLGYKAGDLPVAEEASERVLSIPLSPFLLKEEQERVIEALWDYEQEREVLRT